MGPPHPTVVCPTGAQLEPFGSKLQWTICLWSPVLPQTPRRPICCVTVQALSTACLTNFFSPLEMKPEFYCKTQLCSEWQLKSKVSFSPPTDSLVHIFRESESLVTQT